MASCCCSFSCTSWALASATKREYSPAGNVTQIENNKTNRSKSLGYDELDRLTSVSGDGTDSFGYDALGNRTWRGSSTYHYE